MFGWASMNDFVPVFTSLFALFLCTIAIQTPITYKRRQILLTIIGLSAASIVLYWAELPADELDKTLTYSKQSLAAKLGLLLIKIKAAVAGVGLAALSKFTETVVRPTFYILLGLSALACSLLSFSIIY